MPLLYVINTVCLTLLVGAMLLVFPRSIAAFTISLVLVICNSLLLIVYYVANFFTGTGIDDSVMFHVIAGVEGAGLAMFPALLAKTLAMIFTLFLFVLIASFRFRRRLRNHKPKIEAQINKGVSLSSLFVVGAPFLSVFAVALNPAALDCATMYENYKDSQYALGDVIPEIARPIELSSVGPVTKKNIVYLYAESIERTFFDETLFPGLLPNLKKYESRALSFHGLHQAPMTGWTIAGMTASQCGIPLSTFRSGRNAMGIKAKFLPGATCLGDLLLSESYNLVYIGGADANFAGKGRFYKNHGFSEVYGTQELEAYLGRVLPVSKWGVYDDVTLRVAVEKFEQLSKAGGPFGLFSLTLDTHPPSGHETPECADVKYGDGENSLLNAIHCTDLLVSEFIDSVMKSPYFENTILIVGSDHLMMRSDVSPFLDSFEKSERENLLWVFGDGVEPRKVFRQGTTLDIAPTVLNLLGYDTQLFGMGRTLLGPNKTLVEQYGFEIFAQNVQSWRIALWDFWNEPEQTSESSNH